MELTIKLNGSRYEVNFDHNGADPNTGYRENVEIYSMKWLNHPEYPDVLNIFEENSIIDKVECAVLEELESLKNDEA